MATSERKQFENFLRERGLKRTPERLAVCEAAASLEGHFDIENLERAVRRRRRRVHRASIYRTLPLLVEAGLIRHVPSNEEHEHYEHLYRHGHHFHLRCRKCGKVVEIHRNVVEKLQMQLARNYGFQITGHTLDMVGYCPDCKRGAGDRG